MPKRIPDDVRAKIIKLRLVDKLDLKVVAERTGIATTKVSQICGEYKKWQKEFNT
jgi:DNA-directed RNA polymerase specialized sigma subunit